MSDTSTFEQSVNAIVEQRIAELDARHQEEMAALQEKLNRAEQAAVQTVATPPMNQVPQNAGGPGTEIAATWSQAEQEAFRD